ncbi:MAG: HAMP domain-containing protein [Spirochaetaceae bacterium]|nr:MAG: HAMP domain-containing protein [Spirochaetaceae bacterium]
MKRKLLTSYVVILLVGTLTTGWLSYSFIRNNNLRNLELALGSYANLITDSLQVEQQSGELRNFFLLAQKYAGRTGVRVTLLDDAGNVLADSADNSIIFQNQLRRPEIQFAMNHEVRGVRRFDENTNQETMFLALPPLDLEESVVIVRLSAPVDALLRESLVFLRYIALSILLGLVLAMVVALVNVRTIVGPVNELTVAATRVAEGDFSTRIEVRTRDELEVLANTFNSMAKELEKTVSTMQQQNVELDSMLSGMTDGALAVGKHGEILLVNREMRRLFPNLGRNLTGESLDMAFREFPEIPGIVRDTVTAEEAITRESRVEIGDDFRILRIKSSLMRDHKPDRPLMGVFLLIQDVTEVRKLENIRSDFVANVTHELRTPLTLISGFVETLQTWHTLTESDRTMALRVIELETERLKRLINGLLSLSEIENIETRTHWRPIPVDSEVHRVAAMVQPLVEEKRLRLTVSTNTPNVMINGSPDWFRQMLMNLVDNAIKYTPAAGNVAITTEQTKTTVLITVSDSGIGIPAEDHQRIFDRFYRVSKVRGDDTAGTGLGLTIVNDIVHELGGSVTLESCPGRGSSFTVAFPSSAADSCPTNSSS